MKYGYFNKEIYYYFAAFLLFVQSAHSLASSHQLALYYPDWKIYDSTSSELSELTTNDVTHIIYAFLAVCGPVTHSPENVQQLMQKRCKGKPTGHVVVLDDHAALKAKLKGNTSHLVYYRGNFGQLKYLKEQQPDLTIIASIGGWTLSEPFHTVITKPQYQANMAKSIRTLLETYSFLGGVQINWEYPGGYGLSGKGLSEREVEKQGYTQLLQRIKTELDLLGSEKRQHFELSIAFNASPRHHGSIDWQATAPLLDFVYLMSYDFLGPWNSSVGHHTNVFETPLTPKGFSVDGQVKYLVQQSVPKKKIIVGSPSHGRGWKGVANADKNSLEALKATQKDGLSASLTESGSISFKDLSRHFLESDKLGYVYYYDQQAEAAVLYHPTSKNYISFESPRSAKAKAQYVHNQGLGGIFLWEATSDHQNQLLDAIVSGLDNKPR